MNDTEPGFPAISIRQPWASYILAGVKDIENRRRATYFRGTILVHASLTLESDAGITDEEEEALIRAGMFTDLDDWEVSIGAIVGMVDIVECVQKHTSDYFEGPYGWVLENPVIFDDPVDYK